MIVTVVSKLWTTDLKNDRDLSVIFYLSYRDSVDLVSGFCGRGQRHVCCSSDN